MIKGLYQKISVKADEKGRGYLFGFARLFRRGKKGTDLFDFLIMFDQINLFLFCYEH